MLPLRKAHKGLLREDLLVLRHIFDLNHGVLELDQDRLNTLKFGYHFPGSKIKDLLLISLDVENPLNTAQLEHQIGLCILDTRDLLFKTLHPEERSSGGLLRTYQFGVGSAKYIRKASHSFCFGTSQHTSLKDLNTKLDELVPVDRDVVLVLHGGVSDLNFLKAAQIDLNYLYVIDTQKAAQHPLDLDHRCTMEEMLTQLDCPFGDRVLHTAGNDANFSLRALLLLARKDAAAANLPFSSEIERLLSIFAEIALSQVPLSDLQIKTEERRQIEQNRKESRARKQRDKRMALRARHAKDEEKEDGEKNAKENSVISE
ncbi:hypothetical protein IFR05_013275 [Cadophora sp. M221]|nr:hypothetical protein IFR05_013275 [Cadophora sp. M221]